VDSSFNNVVQKQRMICIQKFSLLNNQQERTQLISTPDSEFVLILSKRVLIHSEKTILKKGFSCTVAKPYYSLDVACAVGTVASELPQNPGPQHE
jgi:hypothetical protein